MSEIAIWQPGEVALPGQVSGQVPNNQLDDWIMVADKVVRLAEVICRSPFVPDGLRNSVPATAAAILTGRELGIPPMTSLANIHVIHGKPGLSALVMRALVLGQGHDWEDVDVSNTRVVLRGRRKGSEVWTTASFSTADAQTAKLALGGYPQDKLYARASARLARRAFADVIAGMPYSIEELEDGIVPDESTDVGATGPGSNGAAAAVDRPRTAQRRARAQSSPPAQAAPVPQAAGSAQPPAGAGGDLPPLPGEEEITAPVPGGDAREAEASTAGSPGPGRPGDEKHKKLVGIVQAHFKRLGYGDDDRADRLKDAARIAGVDDLASLNDLTHEDLSLVADALAKCRDRDRLKAVLVTLDDPRNETAGE